MNPDTKLTDEEIRAICQKHGIIYNHHARITTGFSHEVHRLNDDLVIKIFNSEDSSKFKTELAMLSSNLAFPKPKLVASDNGQASGRSYIIMSFVPGKSLGSGWHLANDEQREGLIKTICESLRAINKFDIRQVIDATPDSWQGVIQKAGERHVNDLQRSKIIDKRTAARILQAIEWNSVCLAGSELGAVYWDIHFDNFIVNEDFELQAIIDLENVELTALDYPLFVIQKMTDEPEKYLREEDEHLADKRDYEKLKGWYRKYYPEMFAFDNLETRIKLYQLMDTLHLLKDWSHVKSLTNKLEQLLEELRKDDEN